jgi:hypothetical protein
VVPHPPGAAVQGARVALLPHSLRQVDIPVHQIATLQLRNASINV